MTTSSDKDEVERQLDVALGNEVRGLRNKRGMSQDDLAAATGFSKQTIYRIEKGARSASMDQLMEICRALDIRPSTLLRAAEQEAGIS